MLSLAGGCRDKEWGSQGPAFSSHTWADTKHQTCDLSHSGEQVRCFLALSAGLCPSAEAQGAQEFVLREGKPDTWASGYTLSKTPFPVLFPHSPLYVRGALFGFLFQNYLCPS